MALISGGLSADTMGDEKSGGPSRPRIMTTQRNSDCLISQPIISRWNHWHQVSATHVNLLSASQGLHHDVPAGAIPESIILPIASKAGKQTADKNSENMVKNDGTRILLQQNLASSKQHSYEKYCTASQPHSMVTVAMPGFSSNSHGRVSQKAIGSRHRRARISKGMKALEELVPNPKEGGNVSVMDDVIDYIKFLKLQLKVLSQSRLGGEATSDPFLYLEGYGHYLFHDQLKGEPLEEIMDELMETEMPAVIQLLDSKGLSVIPMTLANLLLQTN